jgi:hypothetical protein
MKLSSYTIAKNCSDITDCNDGIKELKEYLKIHKHPVKSVYIRYYKLVEKLKKLTDENI